MCVLKFVLLLLISSQISGGCQPSISVTGGPNVCSGQDFTLTCQLDCDGPSNHVKLVKEEQIQHSLESLNNNLSIHVHSANKNHSGIYSCQTENGSKSRVYVTVKDCSFSSTYKSEYLPTVNTTSSSRTNTTYQGLTPSRADLEKFSISFAHRWILCSEWVPSEWVSGPVLIWYMLFKTVVFLIISITAALITMCKKH